MELWGLKPSEWIPMAMSLIALGAGAIGWKVKRDAAQEDKRNDAAPGLTQIAAQQIEAQFARYEARLTALEKRDEERERKLAEVEADRERLAEENVKLKNRVTELEHQLRELQATLHRPAGTQTRIGDET